MPRADRAAGRGAGAPAGQRLGRGVRVRSGAGSIAPVPSRLPAVGTGLRAAVTRARPAGSAALVSPSTWEDPPRGRHARSRRKPYRPTDVGTRAARVGRTGPARGASHRRPGRTGGRDAGRCAGTGVRGSGPAVPRLSGSADARPRKCPTRQPHGGEREAARSCGCLLDGARLAGVRGSAGLRGRRGPGPPGWARGREPRAGANAGAAGSTAAPARGRGGGRRVRPRTTRSGRQPGGQVCGRPAVTA